MAFSWNLNGKNWFAAAYGRTVQLRQQPDPCDRWYANVLPAATNGGNIPFGVLQQQRHFIGFLQALRTEGWPRSSANPASRTPSAPFHRHGGETPILTSSGQRPEASPTSRSAPWFIACQVVLGNGKIHLEVRPKS